MNRSRQVSKAALAAVLLSMGLLARNPPATLPAGPRLPGSEAAIPAALATAEPPRLTGFAPTTLHPRLSAGCASIRRELRFEMISDESQEQHDRRPAVCLAVYHPGN